ncbi:hypothetical protein XA68_12552 [Ophiocordyceps unilateralis]|uniref:Uncharacterized protein n=1 Tax=Ophiocordyceps unilateralis TaxID=268505 RepID=A0A2A9PNP9_OPHUN|nr:hypothetical protein XA68_12552 [Ophiocordyceps unilateralis]
MLGVPIYRVPPLVPALNSEAQVKTSTQSTGPYDRNFQQHLIHHAVYPAGYIYPDGERLPRPDNLDEIREVLAQRRPSLSSSQFPETAFEAFLQSDTHAVKQAQVMTRVVPTLEGTLDDPSCAAGDIPFKISTT